MLNAVVGAVKFSVGVKGGTYHTICNNYRIIENYLHCGPKTDKKFVMISAIVLMLLRNTEIPRD
jgi:hypothetical protein